MVTETQLMEFLNKKYEGWIISMSAAWRRGLQPGLALGICTTSEDAHGTTERSTWAPVVVPQPIAASQEAATFPSLMIWYRYVGYSYLYTVILYSLSNI